jgi:predicted transcriptional regulator
MNQPSPSDDEQASGLSELQLALMQVLWRQQEASVAEVAEALRPERDLAHTTVATLLTRLEKRGLLASRREARALLYRPLLQPEAVQKRMVGGLLSGLFGGRPSQLLAHLVGQGQVSADELQAMRELLAQAAEPKDHV